MPNPLEISLDVNDQHVEQDLRTELITGGVGYINDHVDKLSARYAYWLGLHEEMEKVKRGLENDYKVWLAKKKHEVRSDPRVSELRSETAKEDAVIICYEEEYRTWSKKLEDAVHSCNVLKNVCEAWRSRKDMLVTLAANYRNEKDAIFTIREKQQDSKNQPQQLSDRIGQEVLVVTVEP